jgi:hypothetical protein
VRTERGRGTCRLHATWQRRGPLVAALVACAFLQTRESHSLPLGNAFRAAHFRLDQMPRLDGKLAARQPQPCALRTLD